VIGRTGSCTASAVRCRGRLSMSASESSPCSSTMVFVDCGEDDSLTPAQARQVARAIMGAVDGLDGDDGLMAEFRFFAHAIWLLILCTLLWLLTYALTGHCLRTPGRTEDRDDDPVSDVRFFVRLIWLANCGRGPRTAGGRS
jgi:hypothetical protein